MNEVFIEPGHGKNEELLKVMVRGESHFDIFVDRRTAMLIAISIMTEIDREDDAQDRD